MSDFFSIITAGFIPSMAAVIIAYGFLKKAPVYDYFIEGARKGLHTSLDILPFLIGIFLGYGDSVFYNEQNTRQISGK